MRTPPLETARLLLRPLAIDDAEQVQALFPQWEIVRYLNAIVPWPYPPDGALTFFRDVALPAMARGDQWNWTLRLKSDPDRIIGSIGLVRSEHENRGFWIAPEWQTSAQRALKATIKPEPDIARCILRPSLLARLWTGRPHCRR